MWYSIGIPVRNEEKNIEWLVHSIFEQSLLPDEVLVCVNNSTDKTRYIIEKLSEEYDNVNFLESKPWKANAWNKIVQRSQNDLMVFCDWDIRFWTNDTIELLLQDLGDNDLKMVWASVLQLPSHNMKPYKLSCPSWQLYAIDIGQLWFDSLPSNLINDDGFLALKSFPDVSVNPKAFFYSNKPSLIDIFKTQLRILKWVRQLLDMWMEKEVLALLQRSSKKTKHKVLLELAKKIPVKENDNLWEETLSTKKQINTSI